MLWTRTFATRLKVGLDYTFNNMALFNVKFFGARQERHEQVKQVKTVVEAPNASDVASILRNTYGYKVINGLKVRRHVPNEGDL